MSTDSYCRFDDMSDISRKRRLSVESLEATRVLELMLREIMLLRKGFVNKSIGGGSIIN